MASSPFSSLLVSPADFHSARTSSRRIIPVAAGRAALLPDYEEQHIPGSVFFNMDTIADTASPYPQMLPTAAHFAASMRALGLRHDDILVVYDSVAVGMYSAPRVAWACRLFGHAHVHVLNNFRLYVAQGLPIAQGPFPVPGPSEYAECVPCADRVIAFDELREIVSLRPQSYQIVDARIPGRFSGRQDEVDPTLRSGHMPKAINVPLAAMLDPETQAFLSVEQLKQVFVEAGLQDQTPVVLTCNSGVTATALDLALQESGFTMSRRVYDGSWMEWTRRAEGELVVRD